LIGDNLAKLSFLSPVQLCIVATLLASFITEFTTNAAAGTILTPVLFAVVFNFETSGKVFKKTYGFFVLILVGKDWYQSSILDYACCYWNKLRFYAT